MKRNGINKSKELKEELVNSMIGFLVQVRASRGPGSQRKWSIILDPQKDIWEMTVIGTRNHRKPNDQQLTTRMLQRCPVMRVG
jgi:hypothetical protein